MALTAAEKRKFALALGNDVLIDVVRVNKKDGSVIVKEMTFGKWMEMKKTKGYFYTAYQKGFSQYKNFFPIK